MQTDIHLQRISDLNHFLHNELSASETYVQVFTKLMADPSGVLSKNHDCHRRRAALIQDQIIEAGGHPNISAETWSGIDSLLAAGVVKPSKHAIHFALEVGEGHGLKLYSGREGTNVVIAEFVRSYLLPAQMWTHNRMRALKIMP